MYIPVYLTTISVNNKITKFDLILDLQSKIRNTIILKKIPHLEFYLTQYSEFFLKDDDSVDPSQLADRFNNKNIIIVIDGNGDQQVTVKDSSGSNKDIKALVSAYVKEDDDLGAPFYSIAD